ncbi:SEC-C metal-binding domain-containing protein [Polynucleobacter sp. MG-28-Ekke-A2]|uniref:YecA family protein n=1 Tax=Polynucleobacter sp. MG-28-Ekke-A2 TaxID=3108276 RepID=UPI002B228B75|nr:SEC-C metal-binding domain-containing protein [Polynucleobacter sp. MG-28-Ekke-A2]MEA9602488.1 SEC-C metal-binding domain-containing protein [Polynucleobacter sp. MG-28-Ekke-A2]
MKQGRNSICSCGSGKKFKRCHGQFKGNEVLTPYPRPLPPEIISQIEEHYSKQFMHKEKHGGVKEIISVEFNGQRVVATGNKLNYSPEWKVFPDFLNHFLCDELGAGWGNSQIALDVQDRHPIMHWRNSMIASQQNTSRDEKGLIGSRDGGAHSWIRLAYDLYLIRQNSELRKKILKRLRDEVSFQGARFEVAVAGMMLAAGYVLDYSPEVGPGKHPEFFAKNRETGITLAVEAKSKRRNGLMGFKGSPKDTISDDYSDVRKLLIDALNKDTAEPLLVFIELNIPMHLSSQQDAKDIGEKLRALWDKCQEMEWKNGFPAIGILFYNDCAPWYINKDLPVGKSAIWAMGFKAKQTRHSFDPEGLLTRIGEGCMQRTNIPLEFPEQR